MQWLETATVDDLRLTFPVLLNWCRNSATKAAKASKEGKQSFSPSDDSTTVTSESMGFPPKVIVSIEEVSKKIASVLEESIDYDTITNNDDDDDDDDNQMKKNSVSALRMSLAGYLHTNHEKMRNVPVVAELERRTKAKISLDEAATNTLNMVNLSSQTSQSISEYISPEEEKDSSWGSWEMPRIHIDLGLGLQQSTCADVCQKFISEKKPLLHPFTGEPVGSMRVKKVFPSKRKPVWIEYFSADEKPLKPDVLAKQGDDLRNDASVTSVSKLCEIIWAKAPIEWTLGLPPTVCAYDVLVTSPDAGYLEMVPGKNFLDLSQNSNDKDDSTVGWEGVDVKKLAPSLVGSYIVNFVLGVRDRHEDNMMVVGDLLENPRMMQIDFGYILNDFPGGVHFDMPRLTMPIPLVDRLNAEPGRDKGSTLMEDLQQDMLTAYLVLRRHSKKLIPYCAHLMSSSYDYKYVESVLRGHHVFRKDKSEKKVIKWISQKLTTQWAHFYFRREIKQGMVSGYYKFVETFESSGNKIDSITYNQKVQMKNFKKTIKGFFKKIVLRTKSTSDEVTRGSFESSHEGSESSSDESSGDDTDDDMKETDMSKLSQRVSRAMEIQRGVSATMIASNTEHGTLDFHDYNDDDDDDNSGGSTDVPKLISA